MTNIKIIIPKNCDNAPKKKLLCNLIIHLVNNQLEDVFNYLKEDIIWDIVGYKTFDNYSEIETLMNVIKYEEIKELIIENVITHGNIASINGYVKGKNLYHFCHVCKFAGFSKDSKIKEIKSYILKEKEV